MLPRTPDTKVVDVIWPDFSRGHMGRIPAVVHDLYSGEVVALFRVNEVAFRHMLETYELAHYVEQSAAMVVERDPDRGGIFQVNAIRTNEERSALVILINTEGRNICHNGATSCFLLNVVRGQVVPSTRPLSIPASHHARAPVAQFLLSPGQRA